MARVSFPVDIGGGLSVKDATIKRYFDGIERSPGGFFPLGASGTWHGAVHIVAQPGKMVHAMADGWVVAARLNGDEAATLGPFGCTNFILVRHEAKGRLFNRVAPAKDLKSQKVYTWFSLYMHLGALQADAGTAELGDVTWLGPKIEGEIVSSVGVGGRNRKADVTLVQDMLTRAGIDAGPVDGMIGPTTRAAIKAFQDQFLYSNPDGRIDVGGSTWDALVHAAAASPKDHGFDEEMLGKIAGGGLVACERPIGAGDAVWIMGTDADGTTPMLHWEVFSKDNVLNGVPQVVDESAFQADPKAIVSHLGGADWFPDPSGPTQQSIARFYASNAAAKGLRELAVRYQSEWGLDLSAALAEMKPYIFTDGLQEQLEPYQWFDPAALAAAKLPDDPVCWHYHPVVFAEKLTQMFKKRALPVYPPRPPAADDLPDSGDEPPECDDEILLYDAGSGLVYVLDKSEYERLLRSNELLRSKKDAFTAAMKAAKDLPADQRANAVEPQLKELLAITQTGSTSTTGLTDPSKAKKNKEWIGEVWAMGPNGGKRPIYVGPKATERMVRKAKSKKSLQSIVKASRSGPTNNIADMKFELIDDAMLKKHPWLQGGGSLLDFIDSANPGIVGRIFGGVTGLDAFFEANPRLFRKTHRGAWHSVDGNMDASAEARLLRWGYETKLGGVFSPKDGKAEFRGTLGGSVDLISGKAEANAYVPKKGIPIPLEAGKSLLVRMLFKGEVSGSVGVAAELSAGVGVQWKPDDNDDGFYGARADAGIELFAGAQVSGKLSAGIQWFRDAKWATLAEFSAGAQAIAGAALVGKFFMDFNAATGKFVIYIKGQIALKIGAGLDFGFEIQAVELIKFIWKLMTEADWGKIAEMSFKAFTQASQMMVAAAIDGLSPHRVTYRLINSFSGWWSSQDKITQLAENIIGGHASTLLDYGTPEAKGMAIHKLTDASWMWDETSETAALKLLKSGKSKREVEKILKSIDPDGRTAGVSAARRDAARKVQRGYDLMSGLVDWGEQDELDNFLISKGISVS